MTHNRTRAESIQAGLDVRRDVLGADYVARAIDATTDFTAPIQELVNEYCWGNVWAREGLARRERSLINLAMMTALNREHELAVHVRGALRNGVSVGEIQEVLMQTAIYVGIPAALESFRIAAEAIRAYEEELAADGDSQGS